MKKIKEHGSSLDMQKLSATAKVLVNKRDAILKEWSDGVSAEVKGAKKLPKLIIIDTIPAFLDNLAQALSPQYPRVDATDSTTIAQEHGGERARLSNYDPDQILQEYQILRACVFESLEAAVTLSSTEVSVLHHSFDRAVREAVTAFVLVQSEIRQQFVAALTHDLRNPLGVALMAAQLILADPTDTTEVALLAAKVAESLKRIDVMIQDLLDATVIRGGGRLELDFQPTELRGLLQDIVAGLSLSYGPRFRLETNEIHGHWNAEGLRRAIENLASNAVKYGGERTPIKIKATTSFDRVIISVFNEGSIVPIEDQEAIFQVFRRNQDARREKQRGWGIGLALVRAMAEGHGGSIGMSSSLEEGTTFIIDIPIDARPFKSAPTL